MGEPDPNFTFTITKKGKKGGKPVPVTEYFGLEEPPLEKWDFTWYEGRSTKQTWLLKEIIVFRG